MTQKKMFNVILASLILFTISSCQVVGGIFKTGMGVGVFVAITIVVLISVLIMRARKTRD